MVDEATIARVATGLRDRAKTFANPVHIYVEREATRRFYEAFPDGDHGDDEHLDIDWELEGWKLLAVAAIEALMLPTERGLPIAFAINGDGSDLETNK